MYQMISSAVVNVPPGNYVMRMLHNQKALYVPQNGHRTSNAPSDTKEDMMEIFGQDVNGAPRELRRLMARRNFGKAVSGHGSNKISLAIDFMVQNEGVYGASIKYGPVIIPSLEYGH